MEAQATPRETCPKCGKHCLTEGPLNEDHIQTHSCITYLNDQFRLASSAANASNQAAERCAGETKRALEQIQELKREIGMLEFDMETIRVQRSNYKHLLQESRKELESSRKELEQATTLLHEQEEFIVKLRRLAAFFSSVIKSGEGWTSTCEAEKRDVVHAWIELEAKQKNLKPSA